MPTTNWIAICLLVYRLSLLVPIVTCTNSLKAWIVSFANKVEISLLGAVFTVNAIVLFVKYFSKVAAVAAVLYASSGSGATFVFK